MSSNFHTPHVSGAPLTSAEVNSPLGELDAQVSLLSDEVFNVLQYGAVGDGVTDCAAAIQAAIDAAEAAGGGTVYMPPGNYKVLSGLSIEVGGVCLRGAGQTNTRITSGLTSTGKVLSIGDLGGVQIEGNDLSDFSIYGNANTEHGIYMRHAAVFGKMTRLKVRDCTGTPGVGIGHSDNALDEHWSWTYESCIIRNNKIGMQFRRQWQHAVIFDCIFTANTTYGLDAEGNPTSTNGGKLFIYGGTFERNGNTDATTGSIYLKGVNLATIASLYGEQNVDFPGWWLKLDSNALGPCRDIVIEGNYFTGSSQANKGIIVVNAANLTIRNNRARNFLTKWLSYEPGTITGVREYENTDTDVVQGSAMRRELDIPLAGFLQETGTPVATAWPATGSTFERMIGIAFDDTTNEGIQLFPIVIPDDFMPNTKFRIYYVWSTSGTSTNAVVWQAFLKVVSTGEAASGTSDVATSVTAAASATQYALVTSRVGSATTFTASPGDTIRLGIRRQANNAGDTFVGDAYLLGVFISRED